MQKHKTSWLTSPPLVFPTSPLHTGGNSSSCLKGRGILAQIVMKLTMKGDYGLRAMLDMAAYYGQGPIESSDIATRQHIPEQYLDQILMVLRKEGLVKSVRGPKGGHMLAKSPSQITMAQVMQALEGYVPPMECLPNPDFCQLSPGCALREVWQKIDALTQQILSSTTIEELAQRHRTGSAEETMYYI